LKFPTAWLPKYADAFPFQSRSERRCQKTQAARIISRLILAVGREARAQS